MLDFTSALYLNFRHASRDLPHWEELTLGMPAALKQTPGTTRVERELAELMGCEKALLATSTLHLFWDLFNVLGRRPVKIFLDAGSYPIIRWGVERAASMGIPVVTFRSHDVSALRRALVLGDDRRPVIVADGFCPACGKLAPLAQYAEAAGEHGGLVVIDDSQALGIYGVPYRDMPYGSGGGGSLRHAGLDRNATVVIAASLAKAFGAPLAVLAGNSQLVDQFEAESEIRVHCSQPSAAAIAAAARSIVINRFCGESLRLKLFQLVARFRQGLASMGLCKLTGFFPVQTLRLPPGIAAETLYEQLHRTGVSAVLHRTERNRGIALSFILTTKHTVQDIDQVLSHLDSAVGYLAPRRLERSDTPCTTDPIMARV